MPDKTMNKEAIRNARLAQGIRFQTQETDREEGRILVSSGVRSRNRDYWTNKPYRLVPSGMRYDAWGKTGLVLFMHNFNIPLGRSTLYLEEGKLWAPDSIDFHRRVVPIATNNWIGDAVGEFDTAVIADLWEEKYLNSVSIHIMMTPEDEANMVELDDEMLIPTSEVIEFSVVTIPGDPEAHREKFLSMGLNSDLVECLFCDSGEQRQQGGLIKPVQRSYKIDNGLIVPGDGKVEVGTNQSDAVHSISSEVMMENEEQDVEVAEVEETEETEDVEETVIAGEVELVAEEDDLAIDTLDLAEALAEDPEALTVLAQAFAANPEVLSIFARAIQLNAGDLMPQTLETAVAGPTRIKFVNNRQTAPRKPARQTSVQQQVSQAPVAPEPYVIPETVPPEPKFAPRDPKRRRRVLNLVR